MKNKKLINSFKYAFKGIGSSIKSERNMKIHIYDVISDYNGYAFKYQYVGMDNLFYFVWFGYFVRNGKYSN